MNGDELRAGLEGSAIVICNDYEFELIRQKTGLDENGVFAHTGALIVTRGEQGSTVRYGARNVAVAAVPPVKIVDPTGVGDAFRGGLLKGLATGADLEVCCRLGSMAATYAMEHLGGQSHSYTWEEFRVRYRTHFGAL
jgi:adenosine kinase